ncbi:MAG: YdcF family protein [Butyrivibrio sp.]|nr:YdcF family protein [Butyrivibrio sp.]
MKRNRSWGIGILWIAFSVFCFLYAVMVFLVRSGTFSFAIWLCGAAFFAICFWFSLNGRWGRVPSLVRRISYVVIGVVVIVFGACQIAILSHFFDKGEEGLDYVIVLGAQMRSSGPSVIYKYRLQKAKEYLEGNEDAICITTGGKGANESVSEGEGGREYLLSLGVSPERVIAETQSMDTEANIRNAMEIIRESGENEEELKIGIVTNGFHVFRGVHLAKKITNSEVCGIAAYMQFRFIPNNMVRECFGILRDLIGGKLAF